MSSEGPKMVERAMGWPEMAGKWPENWKVPVTHGGRRRRFVGPVPARPAAVGREISRPASSGCPPPIPPARVQ